MVSKLNKAGSKGWRWLKDANLLPMVLEGFKCIDRVADIDATFLTAASNYVGETMSFHTSQILTYTLGRGGGIGIEENAALGSLPIQTCYLTHGETIQHQGAAERVIYILLRGMALRCQKTTHSSIGVISSVHIPGDFLNLHALIFDNLDYSMIAQGECKVAFVDAEKLRWLSEESPLLKRQLWRLTLADAKFHRVWLTAAASLRANERIAHFLCELHARYKSIGFTSNGRFNMPLFQKDFNRLFGISRSHANRAVQELRDWKLIEWRHGCVQILDLEGLQLLGQFDPEYLELGAREHQCFSVFDREPRD